MQYLEFLLARHDTGAALPSGKMTVKVAGTSTLASVYALDGSGISQPVPADINGVIGLAASNGSYDFYPTSADGGYIGPTIHRVQIFDLADMLARIVALEAGGGSYVPALKFNDARNSGYVTLVLAEDF